MNRITNRIVILLLALFTAGLVGCGEERAYDTAFTNSQAAWLKAKQASSSSYLYETEFSSFSGYGELTVITVENDIVSKRRFASYENFAFREGQVERWVEEGAEIGSHLTGAAAVSLDRLYDHCSDEILTADAGENEIFFSVDEQGLLKTCLYVPNGCLDDCEVGIRINAIDMM